MASHGEGLTNKLTGARMGVRVELAVRPDELSKGENDGPQTYLPQLWQRKRDSH